MANSIGRRRVGSYSEALEWIALNDDTEWLEEDNGHVSVSLCLVADVFGREREEAVRDLRKVVANLG